jgi:hypothetical protein
MVDLITPIVDFFSREVTFGILNNSITVSWFKVGLMLGLISFLLAVIFNSRKNNTAGKGVALLRTVIVSPVIEEVIFRLVLIPVLYILLGNVVIAIAGSAFLFGLGHVVYGGMKFVDSFITGLIWGWAFVAIGIEVTILAHMTHNFLATLMGG